MGSHWNTVYYLMEKRSCKKKPHENAVCQKQNRSTVECTKLEMSVDMTSSGKNGLNIRTKANPK